MRENEHQTLRNPRRTIGTALVLGAALSIGLLFGFGPTLLRNDSTPQQSLLRVDRQHSVEQLNLPGPTQDLSVAEFEDRLKTNTPTISSNAPTALAAVTRFFDAQIAARQDDAYAVLSSADRSEYSTAAVWRERRPQVLPDVVKYSVGEIAELGSSTATVAVELRLRAGLDETIGLVPAMATASIQTVFERGAWHVALQNSRTTFAYLSPSSIPAAVTKWVEARQQCKVAQQWRSTLYGEGADFYAQSLCNSKGKIKVSQPQEFSDRGNTSALIAAFGPKVGLWARLVSVDAPVEFDVVLAPVDQHWLVIGVLTNPSSQGQG